MSLSKLKGRHSTFNPDWLNETDGNGDNISVWCRKGGSEEQGFCVFCNSTINCSNHGISALKRHAAAKRHTDICAKHRNDGTLKRPSTSQTLLEAFSQRTGVTEMDRAAAADTYFVLGTVLSGLPYSWGDTASAIFPLMFPDSQTAKNFQCGRKKVSYIVSDGLGPYFKDIVVQELNRPGVFFTIQVDETPIPEQRCQQLDVLVRYFSDRQKRVVVEHLQSFQLGSATADILLNAVKEAVQDLPRDNLLCFYSDGPNVMKSLKRRLKEDISPALLDIGECSLHKVHNAFGHALAAFGSDVEAALVDTYCFFKNSASRSERLKASQIALNLPENVFLRHVSSRWLTLGPALDRLIQQLPAVKEVVLSDRNARGGVLYNRLKLSLTDKAFLAKALFLRNCTDLFVGFLTLFQKTEPLLHVLFSEMEVLIKKVLGRFLRREVYQEKSGEELKLVDIDRPSNWKEHVEIGADTEAALSDWAPHEKKQFRVGARSFYIKAAGYLLSRLPLGNSVLKDLRCLNPSLLKVEGSAASMRNLAKELPQVIAPHQVSSLMDEFSLIATENVDYSPSDRLDEFWQSIFELKLGDGALKYPLLGALVRALLSLSHGNADVERGFSENRRMLRDRASLSISSVNGLRSIMSFSERFGRNAAAVPLSGELIRAVKGSRKRQIQRLEGEALEEPREKKSKSGDSSATSKAAEEKELQAEVDSAKKMLSNADLLISRGMSKKCFGDVQSGQSLLKEGQKKLSEALSKLHCLQKSK
ncbi:uncharacterized protein LOC144154903 [Haemaphysalis longicornis]